MRKLKAELDRIRKFRCLTTAVRGIVMQFLARAGRYKVSEIAR